MRPVLPREGGGVGRTACGEAVPSRQRSAVAATSICCAGTTWRRQTRGVAGRRRTRSILQGKRYRVSLAWA